MFYNIVFGFSHETRIQAENKIYKRFIKVFIRDKIKEIKVLQQQNNDRRFLYPTIINCQNNGSYPQKDSFYCMWIG